MPTEALAQPAARLIGRLEHRRYLMLLVGVLLLTVLHPLLPTAWVGWKLFDLLFTLILVAAVFAVGQRRRPLLTAAFLAAPVLAAVWASSLAGRSAPAAREALFVAAVLGPIAFLGFVTARVLYDVLQSGKVTGDKLCGAMCGYLLAGIIWAYVYAGVVHFDPAAFSRGDSGAIPDSDAASSLVSGMLYYSMVTLSTLGYGDITPVSQAAKTFAWLEAVTGQLYVAVLIARLVGLHIAHSESR
jgi:hypothetical protein